MHFLDLTTRKLFFDVEKKANQTKHNAPRLAVAARGLHDVGVHNVLEDKSGAPHGVDVNLVVRSTHGIHINSSVPKKFSVVVVARLGILRVYLDGGYDWLENRPVSAKSQILKICPRFVIQLFRVPSRDESLIPREAIWASCMGRLAQDQEPPLLAG